MGWCSATYIFDNVASLEDQMRDKNGNLDTVFLGVLERLAISLSDADWDCHPDSDYWDDPEIGQILKDVCGWED